MSTVAMDRVPFDRPYRTRIVVQAKAIASWERVDHGRKDQIENFTFYYKRKKPATILATYF